MEGRPLEDAELVDLARDGDVPAYEELVSRYQGIAYRVAWLVARQAGEAEDAVQEAFVKAYYALPRFRARRAVSPVAPADRGERGDATAGVRWGVARPWSFAPRAATPGGAAPSPEAAVLARGDAEALVRALGPTPGTRPDRDRVPVPLRSLRGRDGRRPRRPTGHREVPAVSRARATSIGARGIRGGVEMSQRLPGMDDAALGQAVAAIADRIAWPAEPNVAAAVAETIRDRERQPGLARPRLLLKSRRRTLVLVIAALLLLGGAAAAAKFFIDLGALTIETIPGRPTALPSAVASGPTVGHPASLSDAEREAGFPATIPARLGAPDGVWFDRTSDGARIVLAWRPTDALPAIGDLPWGAVLYEFRGESVQAAKTLYAEGDTFGDARVDGKAAFWITGEHELDLITGEGTFTRYRVTGNILVWDVSGSRPAVGDRAPQRAGGPACVFRELPEPETEPASPGGCSHRSRSQRRSAMWLRRSTLVCAMVVAMLSFGGGSASAGGGCFHELPPTNGTGDTVEITANCFEATVLHVDSGTKVTWVNRDPYAHTVTGVGGTWGDFAEIAHGDSVSYRFDGNGVYLYSCLIHPGMVGAVVVGDGSGDAGLDPAAVVALSADPPPPAATTTAPAASNSSAWAWSALLAGVIGLGIGTAFARRRRSSSAMVKASS